MNEIKFVDGLIVKKPSAKAPEFIKFNLSLNREKLINFLQNQEGEWINADVLEKKDGSGFYAKINDWKPEKNSSLPLSEEEKKLDEEIEKVPF